MSQYNIANLSNLIGFGMGAITLQVYHFRNVFLAENVVTSSTSLFESK